MKLSDKLLSAIRGDSVPKADFEKVKADLEAANQKISTLEGQLSAANPENIENAAIEALDARITELQTENELLKAQKEELEKKLAQPSRQAAAILARAGVETINQNVAHVDSKMDFPALVKAQMTNGKGKVEAVRFVIKQFPAEYAEWLKSGDTSKL